VFLLTQGYIFLAQAFKHGSQKTDPTVTTAPSRRAGIYYKPFAFETLFLLQVHVASQPH
jgi:hypothetical protein